MTVLPKRGKIYYRIGWVFFVLFFLNFIRGLLQGLSGLEGLVVRLVVFYTAVTDPWLWIAFVLFWRAEKNSIKKFPCGVSAFGSIRAKDKMVKKSER